MTQTQSIEDKIDEQKKRDHKTVEKAIAEGRLAPFEWEDVHGTFYDRAEQIMKMAELLSGANGEAFLKVKYIRTASVPAHCNALPGELLPDEMVDIKVYSGNPTIHCGVNLVNPDGTLSEMTLGSGSGLTPEELAGNPEGLEPRGLKLLCITSYAGTNPGLCQGHPYNRMQNIYRLERNSNPIEGGQK